MPLVKVENREGKPLQAEIYKDSEKVGVADVNGQLELPAGDYKAKLDGYDDKTFRVRNQATPNFVAMATLAQVNPKSEGGLLKNLTQGDLIVLFFVGAIVVGLTAFGLIKKVNKASFKI